MPILACLLACLLACRPAAPGQILPAADSAPDTGAAPHLLRFAVIADPHVYDPAGENAARLAAAVEWINDEAPDLVLVLGDIGWGDGLIPARDILSGLSAPWVPINGDNEIQNGGDDANYDAAYLEIYDALAVTLEGWRRAGTPVTDPVSGQQVWLQNVAFTHRGVRFVGLDWASRVIDPLLGEVGDLHDFPGGTLAWLEAALAAGVDAPPEGIVLFSHIPMHLVGFTAADNDRLQAVIRPSGGQVWADLAGHYHVDARETAPAGYEVIVTDAAWDDAISVRIVDVRGDDRGFLYTDQIGIVPF